MIKLDIGSGSTPKEGYQGVDLYANGFSIIKAPMDKLPYETETVDAIYSSHALEHIPKVKVLHSLLEWYRVLKPRGYLFIEVPNLAWCCTNWLKHQDNGWNMDALFGNQDTPGQFHMTGFTKEIMFAYLRDAGFHGECTTANYWSHDQDCLVFETQK